MKKNRRIAKSRIKTSLNKSSRFLKKEAAVSNKIATLEKEIAALEAKPSHSANLVISLKRNMLAVLVGERKLMTKQYAVENQKLMSHLAKNDSLDSIDSI